MESSVAPKSKLPTNTFFMNCSFIVWDTFDCGLCEEAKFVAAKRGRDDQTEAKYSMDQGNRQLQSGSSAGLRCPAAAAGLVELVEKTGRAVSGQGLQPMRLTCFHREPDLVTLRAELFGLLLHRVQPIRVELPGVHVDAQAGQGFDTRRRRIQKVAGKTGH